MQIHMYLMSCSVPASGSRVESQRATDCPLAGTLGCAEPRVSAAAPVASFAIFGGSAKPTSQGRPKVVIVPPPRVAHVWLKSCLAWLGLDFGDSGPKVADYGPILLIVRRLQATIGRARANTDPNLAATRPSPRSTSSRRQHRAATPPVRCRGRRPRPAPPGTHLPPPAEPRRPRRSGMPQAAAPRRTGRPSPAAPPTRYKAGEQSSARV